MAGTDSELKDAKIQVLDGSGTETDVVPVQFNPTEYSLSKSVQYGEQQLTGVETPVTQFVSGDAESLSMELFFDTYEKHGDHGPRTDVRELTGKLDRLLTAGGDDHAPPHCRFVWGSLVFKAVLESADEQFTMFLPNGVPVRARVNVTFKGYSDSRDVASGGGSGGGRKARRVTAGESLWQIATEEFGDPGKWRLVAEANGIENPRELEVGVELTIPSTDA